MTAREGMRVLRGPDWQGGDADGGEGHLGTVVTLLDGHKVRVAWDSGQEYNYRSGAEGKYDLRIFDTAPVGIRHDGKTCSGCDEQSIYGMLWHCQVCRACDLCPLCYVTDKHDIKHGFLRVNEPGSTGEPVKKRSVSLKIRAMGIFPGAKVKRGRDWAWADQDGGLGTTGEVLGFENVAPESSRNIVRVQWPGGKANSYRLGFNGNVDLTCVEEEAGTYYYRDHLPVLSTTTGTALPSTNSSTSVSSDNSAIFSGSSCAASAASSFASVNSASGDSSAPMQGASSMDLGDKVVIHVDEDKLKELQLQCGGCTATMLKCIGKTGEIASKAPNGAVGVKFENSKVAFRFNPETLTRVPQLKVGDMVRIKPDLEQVKLLNKRVGWKSGMETALGKVGQVTKIDSDGDVVVSFGKGAYMFSPACCIPVSGSTSFDSVTGSNTDTSDMSSASSVSSDNSDGDYMDLHRDIMKLVAAQLFGMAQPGLGTARARARQSSGDSDMDKLYQAVAKGDMQAARTLCQENKALVNTLHKGVTPLILACHEGKKDMCSLLLAQGADINKLSGKGNTPLGASIEGKKEHIAMFLLEKGANPNAKNSKGRNPVHLAAYCNMPEVIKALVQKGADPNLKDQYGDTPLHDAIDRENNDAVDMLIRVKTVDLQAPNKDGFNALQRSCFKGNSHATGRILARDAGQVDKLLDGKYAALHIAATNDHVECVRLLIKNGNAQVDIEGHAKLTPLHLACVKAHVRSLEALLELGASANKQDGEGNGPLHLTVGTSVDNPESPGGQNELKQRIRMAAMLLSKGAYPDLCNKKGAEPLQCCPHPAVRETVKHFMRENPGVIKKCGSRPGPAQGRAGGGAVGMEALMQMMTMPCAGAGCTKMADITVMPCGHKILCRNCCLKFSECPLCERSIERRLHKRGDGDGVDLAEACKQM